MCSSQFRRLEAHVWLRVQGWRFVSLWRRLLLLLGLVGRSAACWHQSLQSIRQLNYIFTFRMHRKLQYMISWIRHAETEKNDDRERKSWEQCFESKISCCICDLCMSLANSLLLRLSTLANLLSPDSSAASCTQHCIFPFFIATYQDLDIPARHATCALLLTEPRTTLNGFTGTCRPLPLSIDCTRTLPTSWHAMYVTPDQQQHSSETLNIDRFMKNDGLVSVVAVI